jgi:hypothetical protein
MNSQSSQARLELEITTLGVAQIGGLPRRVRKAFGDHVVFEVWVPIDREEIAFEILPTLTCEVLLAESQIGVVRAAQQLGVSGGEKRFKAGRDEFVSYQGRHQLITLLRSGWNASLETMQVFPGLHGVWDQKHRSHGQLIKELFKQGRFAVACGHDGENMQVIRLSARREDVWQNLITGAAVCGVELTETATAD